MISLSLRRLGRPTLLLMALAAFAIAAALQITGALRPIDDAFADWRARRLARTVNSDVVIVEIDSASMDALGDWPWPREYHAQMIGQVTRSAPRSLFLDLDFSTLSNTFDDALLETALARPRDYPLQLPIIMRPASATGEPAVSAPRSRFVRGVELVIEAHELAADGLTRTWRNSWKQEHGWQRSVIDPMRMLPEEHDVIIDYSILPTSFTRLSAADVLAGRVPQEALSGKRVFVGPTVPGIGFMLPVPVYGALPAVVVQAIAYETVKTGAPIVPAQFMSLLLIAGWTLLLSLLYGTAWRRNLVVLVLSSIGALALGYLAFEHQRLWLSIAVPVAASLLLYVAATLRSLDSRVWRAMASAFGIERRDPRIERILEASQDPLLCVDDRAIIRAANAAAARMFGCFSHDLVGQPLGRFVTLFAGEGAEARLLALDDAGRDCDSRTLSGEVFPVEIASRQLWLDPSRVFAVSVRDLRERRVGERRVGDRRQPEALDRSTAARRGVSHVPGNEVPHWPLPPIDRTSDSGRHLGG